MGNDPINATDPSGLSTSICETPGRNCGDFGGGSNVRNNESIGRHIDPDASRNQQLTLGKNFRKTLKSAVHKLRERDEANREGDSFASELFIVRKLFSSKFQITKVKDFRGPAAKRGGGTTGAGLQPQGGRPFRAVAYVASNGGNGGPTSPTIGLQGVLYNLNRRFKFQLLGFFVTPHSVNEFSARKNPNYIDFFEDCVSDGFGRPIAKNCQIR